MPRNRRTTQAQPQRILPTTEQMFDQYWSQVPVIHQETSDDWQPAFDQGAQSGFGSQINPPTQPAPAAAVVTPQVSATTVDAPVAQAPQEADTGLRRMQAERRMLDEMNGVTPTPVDAEWSDSQRNMVSQIGNYGNTSEASVADALSQVAADGGRDANAAELSGVDYLDSNQDMERAAVSGQLDSDKGKQESFGLVGAEKEEDKPLTEQDYLRQAQEDTSVGRTIQGIFAALGMLGGSDTWVRENRNIADDINAQPMKLYNQRRAVRENQRIANKQRSDIRQQTEAQLGAQKEAAQLADPTSNQSRRLQGMYSVRLSMAVPGMSASDIQSYLGDLPYSDEASREALDNFLQSAEKARSEGRALQHEEAMRHLENIKSFINVNTSALARMDSARNRGGGGGGGGRNLADGYVSQMRELAHRTGVEYTPEMEAHDRNYAQEQINSVGNREYSRRLSASSIGGAPIAFNTANRVETTANMGSAVQSDMGIAGTSGWSLRQGAPPLNNTQVNTASAMGRALAAVPAARRAARYLQSLSGLDRATALAKISRDPEAAGHIAAIENLQDKYRIGQGMGAPQAAEMARLQRMLPTDLRENLGVLLSEYRSIIGAIDEIERFYNGEMGALGLEPQSQGQASRGGTARPDSNNETAPGIYYTHPGQGRRKARPGVTVEQIRAAGGTDINEVR